MKQVSKITVIRVIVFHLVIIYLAIVALMHCGCQVLKTKRSSRNDSTATAQVVKAASDSSAGGIVSKSNTASKEENEWWKKTFMFPTGRDTTVNNFYPQTVILEGGKGTKEQTTTNYDSAFYSTLQKMFSDSLSSIKRTVEENSKDKESKTKGLTLMAALLIMAGYVVVTKGLGWVLSKYTIVKK